MCKSSGRERAYPLPRTQRRSAENSRPTVRVGQRNPLRDGPRYLVAILIACGELGLLATSARANTFVQMDYNLFLPTRVRGTVFIELFDDRPLTRDNFLAYVNGGKYNGSLMHRLAFSGGLPFVLQGGGYYLQYVSEPPPLNVSLNPNVRVDLDGNPNTSNPPVNNEFNNFPFRTNARGTLAMAKSPGLPDSATSEFFFNLSDNAGTPPNGLDFQNGGFTVFAQVVGDGLNLIDAYSGMVTENRNPDSDDNGIADANGPFNTLPVLTNGISFLPLILERAKVVDYLGNGLVTNVPEGGLTFSARDAFFDTGTVFTGTSWGLTIGVGRTLGIREGYALNRPLANNGTLAPGLSLGAITIQGNFFQFSAGTLEMQLGGLTPDTQYDQVIATGNAYLAGKLRVLLTNSFVPAPSNSFTLLTSTLGVVGNFTSFELPQLSAGLVWNIAKSPTAYSLSVAAADYNRNGIADMADYVIWRKTRNTNVTPYSGADGNGDGIVNDLDFAVWRSNYGNVRGTVSGAGSLLDAAGVPEPSSALLVLAGAAMFAARRRRRG